MWGKTSRDDDSNVFGIKRNPQTKICPTAAEARLMGHLKEMGSDNGETLHGFRTGCPITLALSGAELSEIMNHVGRTRPHTALHYLQLASARLSTVDIPAVTSEWNDVD